MRDVEMKPARQSVEIPEELRQALAQKAKARAAFDKLPPSHRREHCRYVCDARKTETRARRAGRVIEMLLEPKKA